MFLKHYALVWYSNTFQGFVVLSQGTWQTYKTVFSAYIKFCFLARSDARHAKFKPMGNMSHTVCPESYILLMYGNSIECFYRHRVVYV